MKCQYCKKDYSGDVIKIHEEWCKEQHEEKKKVEVKEVKKVGVK